MNLLIAEFIFCDSHLGSRNRYLSEFSGREHCIEMAIFFYHKKCHFEINDSDCSKSGCMRGEICQRTLKAGFRKKDCYLEIRVNYGEKYHIQNFRKRALNINNLFVETKEVFIKKQIIPPFSTKQTHTHIAGTPFLRYYIVFPYH